MSVSLPIPIPLAFDLRLDARVLAFTVGVTVAAGLVAGLAPALKASKPDVIGDLKGDGAGAVAGGRRFTLRDGLVCAQIAVTTVLLVLAGLLSHSLHQAQKIDIGFRPEGLAVVSTELDMLGYTAERGRSFWDQAMARVRPGVEAAAPRALPSPSTTTATSFSRPQRARRPRLHIDVTQVSPNTFRRWEFRPQAAASARSTPRLTGSGSGEQGDGPQLARRKRPPGAPRGT
jgi:hypothetical protein